MRIFVLLQVYLPVAFLAFWHGWDWGGSFRWRSGLWTWSARSAVALLAGMTLWLVAVDTARLPDVLYLQMGLGFGIAIFPGAACSLLSSFYPVLAAAQATRIYALVGWAFIVFTVVWFAVELRDEPSGGATSVECQGARHLIVKHTCGGEWAAQASRPAYPSLPKKAPAAGVPLARIDLGLRALGPREIQVVEIEAEVGQRRDGLERHPRHAPLEGLLEIDVGISA